MMNNTSASLAHPLRWLFLDLNAYFASVEQQENPQLRGKPMAVVPVLVDSTCCIAVSYEAKAFGIKTGTSVAEAKLRCPKITFTTGRHNLYVQYHHAIVEAVESCLHVDSVLSIDEMVGRLRGRECERENAIKLAHQVKAAITKRVGPCLRSSIGIAPNRFLAKVAGDMEKPDGLTILESHQLPQALFRLKLRDLYGIGRNMERRLRLRGISSVEQLCSLNDATMHSLWGGIGGDRYAASLRGEEVELPPIHHHSLGHSHVLEPEVRSHAGALRVAKKLTAKAALRLRKMDYFASGLSVAVRFSGNRFWDKKIKLDETQDTALFLKTLLAIWQGLPNEKPTWVGVTLAPLIASQQHIPSLFANHKSEKLSHVIDAINNKYGKNTAYFANLHDVTEQTAPTRIPFTRVPNLSEF